MKVYELINLLNTLTEEQKEYEISMEVEIPDDVYSHNSWNYTIKTFEIGFVADKHIMDCQCLECIKND